jgi:hypothetical protein
MELKRHAHIYDELLKLDIRLNYQDVPTPAYIQQAIIQCNNFQLKVERFFIEVTRDLATAERMFSLEKLDLTVLRTSTLTNNEKIKRIPTGKEREAAADELLEDNHRKLLKLENDVNDLRSILSAIKQKQSTLKSTNADIKSLLKLMEQQVNRMNIGHPDDPDVKELSKTFSEIDKLEEEFELDEVESSVEISQSEDSSEVLEEESVESGTSNDLGELVALEGLDLLDESIVLGDELKPEPKSTANWAGSGQNTKDIGEITTKSAASGDVITPEPIPTAPPSEDRQGAEDIEDELASFLTDDNSEIYLLNDEDGDGNGDEQIVADELVIVNDSVADTVDSAATPDIEIGDDMDTDVESSVSEPPKVDVDLSDIGIDLDLGDIDLAPEPVKSTPRTNTTKSTKKNEPVKKSEPVKADVKKAEDPPAQKPSVMTKKTETVDIDLNDLLNSL